MGKTIERIFGLLVGTIAFGVVVWAFFAGPVEMPDYRFKILAVLSSLGSALFAVLFPGRKGIVASIQAKDFPTIMFRGGSGVFIFATMLWFWNSPAAPIKGTKVAQVPFITNEDIHLGDNIYPDRWGTSHNPLHQRIFPQQSHGLVYFDKQGGDFMSGQDGQTKRQLEFVLQYGQHIKGFDFSAYRWVSCYDGNGNAPEQLQNIIADNEKERMFNLGPSTLFTNRDGTGNFYERYAAIAKCVTVDFLMPMKDAGMQAVPSSIDRVEFVLSCYSGGLRVGQADNFVLYINGSEYTIHTRSRNMREKEYISVNIDPEDVDLFKENLVAVYVLPWQEQMPRSYENNRGPVHFRDIGIIEAHFNVTGL